MTLPIEISALKYFVLKMIKPSSTGITSKEDQGPNRSGHTTVNSVTDHKKHRKQPTFDSIFCRGSIN
ncbi:MAG: hypothetical protein ACJAS9_003282 [Polaribacter sp.]|jgi:hypothetical protein